MDMYDKRFQFEDESTLMVPIQIAGTHHVNLQDRSGKVIKIISFFEEKYFTLLVHNCAKGFASTVEELALDANIDVNLADNEGNTALHHASQAGHSSVVQVLLERFPALQIDQQNKLGQTALIKSAIQDADPYLRDYGRQFCALEWAEYVGRTECAHMIAHFMLDSPSSCHSNSGGLHRGERVSSKKRNGALKNSPHQHYKFKYSSSAAAAAVAASSSIVLPIKKLSDTACNNFKQVACLAAIPLIGGAVNCELPVVVRPRVRSAPPIPTFKITTPQQTYNKLNTNNNKIKNATTHNSKTPLMATVVDHCRVRPSSSCA